MHQRGTVSVSVSGTEGTAAPGLGRTLALQCGLAVTDADAAAPLGRGVHGRVLRATETTTGTDTVLALKVHTAESATEAERAGWLREAVATALVRQREPDDILERCGRDHVARVVPEVVCMDTGAPAPLCAASLPVATTTLAGLITGRAPTAELLVALGSVYAALWATHAAGIVHNDVKPENVLVRDGWTWLADFSCCTELATPRPCTGAPLFHHRPGFPSLTPPASRGSDHLAFARLCAVAFLADPSAQDACLNRLASRGETATEGGRTDTDRALLADRADDPDARAVVHWATDWVRNRFNNLRPSIPMLPVDLCPVLRDALVQRVLRARPPPWWW